MKLYNEIDDIGHARDKSRSIFLYSLEIIQNATRFDNQGESELLHYVCIGFHFPSYVDFPHCHPLVECLYC